MQQTSASQDSLDLQADTYRVRPVQQRDIATVCIYGLSILSAGLFLFLPMANLLSPSPWQRYMGAVHGFASLMSVVVVAYAGHLAFPLLSRTYAAGVY